MTINPVPERPDLDEPFIHQGPRSPLGKALFGLGMAYAASTLAQVKGSPEAIADCQRRQREAQKAGQRAVDALDYETGHEQDEIEGQAV